LCLARSRCQWEDRERGLRQLQHTVFRRQPKYCCYQKA